MIPRSYYSVWVAVHRAKLKAGLDSKIQTCHGFRKYFENALDEASIDHERKMMIEGHFAGTRAKHYTDRDEEQLRDLYQKAYLFIDLNIHEAAQLKGKAKVSSLSLEDLEIHLARQNVLEAKLTLLEGELDRMKCSFRILEKRSQD